MALSSCTTTSVERMDSRSNPPSHASIERLEPSWSRFTRDEAIVAIPEKRKINRKQLEELTSHAPITMETWKDIEEFDVMGRRAFWVGSAAMILAATLEGKTNVSKTIATGVWGTSWLIWLGSSSVSIGLMHDIKHIHNLKREHGNHFNNSKASFSLSSVRPSLGYSFSF